VGSASRVSSPVQIALAWLAWSVLQEHGTAQGPSATAPFRVLDGVEGDRIDLHAFAVRPLARDGAGRLYAVNPHASKVVRFDDLGGSSAMEYDVPWGPVSIAVWVSSQDAHAELLVVTRGTHGLTRLDPVTGEILGFLELPPEPGDLLLLGDQAFVSSSALDQVVEIDLLAGAVVDRFDVRTSRHLLFLSPDGLGNVLVTPMLSGNDTMPLQDPTGTVSDPLGTVLDMGDPAVAVQGLPDEDVFRLIPGATPFTGTVEVVAKGVGTNLFAHGIDPTTGELWVLGTEAKNAGPGSHGEAELRGRFAEDRVTRVVLPAPGAPPKTEADHAFVALDGFSEPIGNPYALAFSSAGFAAIAGLFTDDVALVSPAGAELALWRLPAGSIPRGLLVDDAAELLYVYAWGTNQVEVYSLASPGTWQASLDVGYDPTSSLRKRGRELFFDGDNSAAGNLACASCHVELGTDFLCWNLSDGEVDDKGALFTQTLKGIAPTRPYHWRGEREFADFNAAFAGLLGGTPLDTSPGGDFDALEAYVFGVGEPANPFEHPERVVTNDRTLTRFDDFPFTVTSPALDATHGQDVFFDQPSVFGATCQVCHQLPTGTTNDFHPDVPGDTGHRSTFVVAGFNGLWRKEQRSRVSVQRVNQAAETRPPLGAATSHSGVLDGVFEFVTQIPFTLSLADREDLAFFLHQVDSGLAPAVHAARFLDAGGANASWVQDYLMAQAALRNCDVAVVGWATQGSIVRHLRWAWDRDTNLFTCEDGTVPPSPLAFFLAQAAGGEGESLFLGLPVGMAERWAIDDDGDGLPNLDEAPLGLEPTDPDWDGDGFLDGTEVRAGSDPKSAAGVPASLPLPQILSVRSIFVTTRVAKFIVETDVPTRLELEYTSNLGDSGTEVSNELEDLHTILLRDLEPSNELAGLQRIYGGTIRAIDELGQETEVPLPATQTLPFLHALQSAGVVAREVVARDLELVSKRANFRQRKLGRFTGVTLRYEVQVEDRRFDPPAPLAGEVVVARVFRNGVAVPAQDLAPRNGPPASVIRTQHSPNWLYGGFGGFGPFVVGTASAANGRSTLEFSLRKAEPGDEITLSIETIGEPLDPATFDPAQPFFSNDSLFDFSSTPAAFRALKTKL